MIKQIALRPKLLSCRLIPQTDSALARALGCDEKKHRSVGIVTCDQDDSLYVALDHATKFAPVDVVYARSFYAGSAHASGPYSGEAMGVIAASDPDEIAEGLFALRTALAEEICFYTFEGEGRPAFFPHVISSLGTYLSQQSGLAVGHSMAYLIAPPMESLIAVDQALKSAQVHLVKYFGPPTETNFGGAYLAGELPEVQAASDAFIRAIEMATAAPLEAAQRPFRLRF